MRRGVDLDTATLRALSTLAGELHFGRSAALLGISQQALTKRIQRLEAELGEVLVDRGDRRAVRLTAAGRRVVPIAETVLRCVDELGGQRTLLAVDVMDEHLAPAAWTRQGARSRAGLLLDAVQRPAGSTAEKLLLSGRAHAAFGRAGAIASPWPAGLNRRLVRLEPVALLVPDGHRWAAEKEISFSDLAGEPLWFPMVGAPDEWQTYVAELARCSGAVVDTTGSTMGYQQWVTDVGTGAAPPSLVGEAMSPPPGAPWSVVPICSPTPVFPWSLLWTDALTQPRLLELLDVLGLSHEVRHAPEEVWLPAEDQALLRAS